MITPVGLLPLTKHRLRNQVLASTTWQTWCGGSGPAADNAYLCEAPPKAASPHVIINHAANYSQGGDGIRDGVLVQSGDLLLYVCDDALADAAGIDVFTDFENRLQALIVDLFAPGNGGYGLIIDHWTFAQGGEPQRVDAAYRDKYGNRIFCELVISYRMWN